MLSNDATKVLMLEWSDDRGQTALIVATRQGNYECISAVTCLCWTLIQFRRVRSVQLLAEGANVDHMCTYQSGGTALHFAVCMKHSKRIIHQLLLHGGTFAWLCPGFMMYCLCVCRS